MKDAPMSIAGLAGDGPRAPLRAARFGPLWGLVAVTASTALCWATRSWFGLAEQVMVYVVAVLATAALLSRRDAVLAAVASVAALDYLFVPPVFGFAPTDLRHLWTLLAFLATSLVVSSYATRVRGQATAARARERRTTALYVLSRALSGTGDVAGVTSTAAQQVRDSLGTEAVVFLASPDGTVAPVAGTDGALARSEAEQEVARRVIADGSPAGNGTDVCGDARALHLPLRAAGGVRGVLAVVAGGSGFPWTTSGREFLDALAALTAVALERAVLVEKAERAHLLVETERTRSTLLSAISHDLRTPLASITGALGALLSPGSSLDEDARRRLLVASRDESERLGRIVTNLLDLARVETGGFVAAKDWFPVEELVTSAIERVEPRIGGRRIQVDVPEELIQVRVDGVLIEQVLVNLLENAAKHTPPGSPIELCVRPTPDAVRFEVLDRGLGIPAAEIDRIFEGFHRLPTARESEGTGLGLALCRAIVRAHGGRIWAENRDGGGAALRFSLPREAEPAAPPEDVASSLLEGA